MGREEKTALGVCSKKKTFKEARADTFSSALETRTHISFRNKRGHTHTHAHTLMQVVCGEAAIFGPYPALLALLLD